MNLLDAQLSTNGTLLTQSVCNDMHHIECTSMHLPVLCDVPRKERGGLGS